MNIKKSIHKRLKRFSFWYLKNCITQNKLRPFTVDEEGIWFKTKYGFSVYSNLVDRILELDVNPDWETMESFFIENNVKQGTIFIDVGANIGYYSMLVASLGLSEVIAIEPSPRTYKDLKRNIEHNLMERNIKPFNIAIGSKDETCQFVTSLGPKDHIKPTNQKDYGVETVPTQVTTLDNLVQNIAKGKNVDFIKVDIEGAEFEFLKGAEKTIQQCKPILLMEIKENDLKKYDVTPSEIFQFMADLNYEYLIVKKTEIIKDDYKKHLKDSRDFIFYPQDKTLNY